MSNDLLKKCIQGDRKAQLELFRGTFSILMGVCRRYKNNKEEAQELLNIGFYKILKNLDKYRPGVPFQAWIKRIMINVIIDEFRKNRKVNELIEYQDFSDRKMESKEVEFNSAALKFEAEELEMMIQQLPPISQKVFNLFAIDGYSHQEIATLLAFSVGTSKWHLSSARKKLKELVALNLNTQKSTSKIK